MDWKEELDKHGYNLLVDELVWHLDQGRIPIAVIKQSKDDDVGFEFRFENETPHFLKVTPDLFNEHWEEAQKITAGFPQLGSIEYIVN
ncbi:MAG TPA: hypothetical protein VNI84_10955 [Pyrinomonadaceae bacterium]|jgi:hypothetical protein|nr:hypothetical protein [Pyrinomonadaceae bacterium]